tara:strand:+ start:832 stop:1065 length:234 start_codon:yes stop_codon:yes gene_type:complete
MKMSNKRLEEIIKEEIKLFTQENKLEEDDTGESLEQRKAKFTKQARAQAATVGEASGDVDRDHAAMKIKIRKGSKDV